jgi:hypothetical protein
MIMEKKIHITVYDDIPLERAVGYVRDVVKHGRISKDDTMFCYLTLIHDRETNQRVCVQTMDYRKSDCFKVYLDKRYDKDGNFIKNY